MTIVLLGKGLVLRGWPWKIEVIWFPGIWYFVNRQPTNHAKKSILKTVGPPTDCKPLAFPLHLDLGSFCWWETCKSQSPSQGAWYKEPLTKTKLWRHRKNQRFFSSCAHFHERFGKNSNHLLHILQKLLLLRVIPTMTFQNSHARLYLNLIVSGEGC